MRIAVMEPLGMEQEKFMQIARAAVGDDVEIVAEIESEIKAKLRS